MHSRESIRCFIVVFITGSCFCLILPMAEEGSLRDSDAEDKTLFEKIVALISPFLLIFEE